MAALLQTAVLRAEENLRNRFRPTIAAALDHVQLRPQNLPERVAREKLIDELLDRVVERGFLTMADLRDALSRNNLKMPDVTSVRQLVLGDQLLQTNRQLAEPWTASIIAAKSISRCRSDSARWHSARRWVGF